MEIEKVGESFKIIEGEKTLTAKKFFSRQYVELPKTAEEFQKGLKNGDIVFVKKGTEIKSHIARYIAKAKDDECCYALFGGKERYKLFGINKNQVSDKPFEWQS